jgi:hypothetical protein
MVMALNGHTFFAINPLVLVQMTLRISAQMNDLATTFAAADRLLSVIFDHLKEGPIIIFSYNV